MRIDIDYEDAAALALGASPSIKGSKNDDGYRRAIAAITNAVRERCLGPCARERQFWDDPNRGGEYCSDRCRSTAKQRRHRGRSS